MSNPIINARRIRLLIDKSNPFNPLLNSLGMNPVGLVNEQATQFELMVYDSSAGKLSDSTTVNNWTGSLGVTVALQSSKNPHANNSLWSDFVPLASINQSCTVANWLAGTDQQISTVVPTNQNILTLGQQQIPVWFCIYTSSTDLVTKYYCLSSFQIFVGDAGIPTS